MELGNNNEQQTNNFDTRPNPNDALFGGMSSDYLYGADSVYVSAPVKKKSNVGIIIGVLVVLCVLAGGIIFNMSRGDTRRFDGYYKLTRSSADGFEMTMAEIKQYSGVDMNGYVEIDGKKGILSMNVGEHSATGDVKVKIEGNDITLYNGSETRVFHYDEAENCIYYEQDGAKLIFDKQ